MRKLRKTNGVAVTRGTFTAIRQQSEDATIMFQWFDRGGYDVDITALRRDFPEVRWHSFAGWASGFDWRILGQQ